MARHDQIKGTVAEYYSAKVVEFGATPQGVDWRDGESQDLRFERFNPLISDSRVDSICDLGCGYGAFLNFLRSRGRTVSYRGLDISAEMVSAAQEALSTDPLAQFDVGDKPAPADLVVASGIFNVRGTTADSEWSDYILDTLDEMWAAARVGIGYNVLTTCSDPSLRRANLFYADIAWLLQENVSRLGDRILIDQSYGLYEATIMIWKGKR